MSSPRPFAFHVPDEDIVDLRARLARTRFPDQAPEAPWTYGADLAYMRKLVDHWREKFDWRAQEARLNAFPTCTTCRFPARVPRRSRCFCSMAGQGRCSSSST